MHGGYCMSTTLTNGLKLPDKGSVDWYADMQNNYTILDGAVGTIAEHTSALSVKAPLVHTHTKSDITDFPVYGTTAGTICEGNDSRLSDARTPVAHTHTKSDVTDLFNSANTWTSINTSQREICISGDRDAYIAPMWEGASSGIAFLNSDATKTFVFGQYTTDANNRKAIDGTKGRLLIRTGERNGETVLDFEPRAANAILGTSTNKWKTLNGINPGALSLPDTTREEPIDRTNWVYDYGANSYYPPEDGWLAIACSGSDYIQIDGSSGWGLTLSKGYDGYCVGIIPVKKNVKVQIRIRATSSGSVVVRKASFYPGTGDPSFTVTPLNNS